MTTSCQGRRLSNVLDSKHLTSERQQVLELWEQGKTTREIAADLKVSTQRVYQQLQKLGLPANKPERATA